MIQKIFDPDNSFWRAMGRVADMFWLNLLWFVCSIPIFTIGPSTTALYYVMLKIADNKEGGMTKQFFHSFKQNFKQGVVIGLVELLLMGIAVVDVMYYIEVKTTMGLIFRLVMLIFGIFMLMSATYVYALLAKFENTTKNILAFSFVMPIRHIGQTLIMLVSEVVIVIATFIFFPPLILLGMGLVSFINCKFLVGIFEKYIPEELRKDPVDEPLPDLPDDFGNPVHIILDADHPEHVVLEEKKDKE